MAEEVITAPIGQIANKKACGGSETANTGKLGCLSLFGTPEHFMGLKKGTKIAAATTIDVAWMTPLIQAGTLVPIVGASSFEDVSGEDSYSTNASGEKRLNLKGLPEYKLMFEEGHEFYRQLARVEGYKSMDFIIIDDEGNWLVAENSDGSFGGFRAGHVTAEITKRKVKGGDPESKSLVVQFLDRLQFDKNYAIVHAESLDFVPEEIPLVNGVNLSYIETPVAGTSIKVRALLSSDNNTTVEGLTTVTDWKVTVDGVDSVPSLVTMNPSGDYDITVSAFVATDIITVDLYQTTPAVSVVDVSGVLFRSSTITDTAV
jgi:hypothetical protein